MTEEPLFDDPAELVDDLLEEGGDEDLATGQTSEEFDDSPIADESDTSEESKKKKLGFNVYDAMMLVSLILITLSIVLVIIEG